MTANAIAMSSQLEAAGLEKRTADAVASAIVDHNDESLATKADVAKLEGRVMAEIAELRAQMRMMMGVQIGTFIGIILLFLGILTK